MCSPLLLLSNDIKYCRNLSSKPALSANLAQSLAENARPHSTLSNSPIIHWFLSKGKTSLIRYLLERDYPGLRIGPEPTTDCFNAVMYGDQEQVINKLTKDN